MEKNKSAETLVGVIIGLIIFSIIALGLINIISYNIELIDDYENINFINILEDNSNNILSNLDINGIQENEVFYINKNNIEKNYEILTGSSNSGSKYININGENVDKNLYNKDIYIREFKIKYYNITPNFKISNTTKYIYKYNSN